LKYLVAGVAALKRANLGLSDVGILAKYPAGPSTCVARIAVGYESELVCWREAARIGGDSGAMPMASSTRGFVPCDATEIVGSPRVAAPATLPELGERDVDCTAGRDEPRCVRLDGTSDVAIVRWLHRAWGVAVDPHRARTCFGTNKAVLFFTGSEANLADAKEVLPVYPMAAKVRLVGLSRWGGGAKQQAVAGLRLLGNPTARVLPRASCGRRVNRCAPDSSAYAENAEVSASAALHLGTGNQEAHALHREDVSRLDGLFAIQVLHDRFHDQVVERPIALLAQCLKACNDLSLLCLLRDVD
jgi:hypothetical protein